MERDGLGVAEVDALTGPLMGRPPSATLRVCDIVGLDTVAHVAETSYEGLPADPWRSLFALPAFYRRMLEENLLGAKVNAGFYRKAEAGIEALDLDTFAYQPVQRVEILESALSERSPARRLCALWGRSRAVGSAREGASYGRASLRCRARCRHSRRYRPNRSGDALGI